MPVCPAELARGPASPARHDTRGPNPPDAQVRVRWCDRASAPNRGRPKEIARKGHRAYRLTRPARCPLLSPRCAPPCMFLKRPPACFVGAPSPHSSYAARTDLDADQARTLRDASKRNQTGERAVIGVRQSTVYDRCLIIVRTSANVSRWHYIPQLSPRYPVARSPSHLQRRQQPREAARSCRSEI